MFQEDTCGILCVIETTVGSKRMRKGLIRFADYIVEVGRIIQMKMNYCS